MLYAEVFSKICHGCQRHENLEDSHEERLWQAEHQRKCKANYQGSAPAMETEGIKRIFEHSEENVNFATPSALGMVIVRGLAKWKTLTETKEKEFG